MMTVLTIIILLHDGGAYNKHTTIMILINEVLIVKYQSWTNIIEIIKLTLIHTFDNEHTLILISIVFKEYHVWHGYKERNT